MTKKNQPSKPAYTFKNDSDTGLYMKSNQPAISFVLSEAVLPATSAELMDLYIQGKDVIKDKKEYIDIILRLPYVDNDNLKAVEVFERWKKKKNLLNK